MPVTAWENHTTGQWTINNCQLLENGESIFSKSVADDRLPHSNEESCCQKIRATKFFLQMEKDDIKCVGREAGWNGIELKQEGCEYI